MNFRVTKWIANALGVSTAVVLAAFSFVSLPLAVYGLHVAAEWSLGWCIVAVLGLLYIVPLGEIVAFGLAIYGLFEWLS